MPPIDIIPQYFSEPSAIEQPIVDEAGWGDDDIDIIEDELASNNQE